MKHSPSEEGLVKWKELRCYLKWYLPSCERNWSNLNIGVGESLFPLIYKDRLLCSRVPNKYLKEKKRRRGSKQRWAMFETLASYRAFFFFLSSQLLTSTPYDLRNLGKKSTYHSRRKCSCWIILFLYGAINWMWIWSSRLLTLKILRLKWYKQ